MDRRKLGLLLVLFLFPAAGCAVLTGKSAEPGDIVVARDADQVMGTEAEVRVPAGGITFTVGKPVSEVAEDQTSDLQGRRAPDDGSFVPLRWQIDDTALPSYALVMATQPEPITLDLVAGDETIQVSPNLASERGPVYVAVPGDGEKVSLEVGYDGVTQFVDAASGDREEGLAAPLYDLPEAPGPAPDCPARGWLDDPQIDYRVTCTVGAHVVLPYLPELGWAAEARSWVIVATEVYLRDVTWQPVGGGPAVEYDVLSGADASTLDGSTPVELLEETSNGERTLVREIFEADQGGPLELEVGRDYELRVDGSPAGAHPDPLEVALRQVVPLDTG